MGKKKDERRRILAIIEKRAAECDEGRDVYFFDADNRTPADELKRHAKRLRALMREIQGHKEAEGTGK